MVKDGERLTQHYFRAFKPRHAKNLCMIKSHMNGGPAKEQVSSTVGEGGFERLTLRHDSGSEVDVYSYGAHITSFRSAVHGEVFYLSSTAEFTPGKAIRGGVPIIFPQFGPHGPLPSHGFARNSLWNLVDAGTAAGGAHSPPPECDIV